MKFMIGGVKGSTRLLFYHLYVYSDAAQSKITVPCNISIAAMHMVS